MPCNTQRKTLSLSPLGGGEQKIEQKKSEHRMWNLKVNFMQGENHLFL